MMRLRLLVSAAALPLAVIAAGPALGQAGIERQTRPETPLPPPPPEPRRPEFERPPVPPPATRPGGAVSTATVLLRDAPVEGVPDDVAPAIAAVKARYVGREVGVEDIVAMREEMTRALIDAGYVTSGAVFTDTDASDGVVALRIVIGTLDRIAPEGLGSLDPDWLGRRFGVEPGTPVHFPSLEARFRRLVDNPAIGRIRAELVPGREQGLADLRIRIEEAPRASLIAEVATSRSPAIGEARFSLTGAYRNALWSGDVLAGQAGVTEGLIDGALSYSVPITADEIRLSLTADRARADIVEDPVAALDVESRTTAFSAGLSVPLYENAAERFTERLVVTGSLAWSRSETFIAGVPFSFSPGPVNGVAEVWTARITPAWFWRGEGRVIVAGATLHLGLGAADEAPPGPATPEADYRYVTAQVQATQRLSETLTAELRMDAQWSDAPLYPSDKFAYGGDGTVRGYRENLALGDKGFAAGVELRWNAFETGVTGPGRDLALLGFVEMAKGWSEGGPAPAEPELHGIGAGIEWTLWDRATLTATYAFGLDDVAVSSSTSLGDQGVFLRLRVRAI